MLNHTTFVIMCTDTVVRNVRKFGGLKMASINDLKRMCKTMSMCTDCPLYTGGISCKPVTLPDNIDEVVDKWVAENPIKTYAMDFFAKFPDARRKTSMGIPIPCIGVIYSEFYNEDCPEEGCTSCWNREMKKDNW